MRPTLRVLHVHRPLIHFLGKRKWPATPEPPHPHPAGPPDYKAHFSDFLKKFENSVSLHAAPSKQTSSSSSSLSEAPDAYREFWQAPERIWNPRVRKLSDEETEAILSGGASLY